MGRIKSFCVFKHKVQFKFRSAVFHSECANMRTQLIQNGKHTFQIHTIALHCSFFRSPNFSFACNPDKLKTTLRVYICLLSVTEKKKKQNVMCIVFSSLLTITWLGLTHFSSTFAIVGGSTSSLTLLLLITINAPTGTPLVP